MSQWTEQHLVEIPSLGDGATPPLVQSVWIQLLMVLILALGFGLIDRQALWHFGLPLSISSMSEVFGSALPLVCVAAAYLASLVLPAPVMRHGYGWRVAALATWSLFVLGVGLLEDHNASRAVLKEFGGFLTLIAMLWLGRYDQVWEALRRPIVVIFYTSLVLILLTYRTPAAVLTTEGFVAGKNLDAPRALDTMAYSIRNIIDIGPLLFGWGISSKKKDIWRLLMIAALGVYVAIDALLFEFRAAALGAMFVVCVYVAVTPLMRVRIPVGPILGVLALAGIGLVIASQTQSFNNLIRRFEQPGGILDSRFDEARSFFDDMSSVDLAIGRGFAATYHGPDWAPMSEYNGRRIWGFIHFGFLGLVLRGGLPLLLLMASFAVPYVLRKPHGWYDNEYNVAAMICVPWLVLNILFNPFDFGPDSFFLLLTWGLCFGRLSTPGPENAWTQPPLTADYAY